ncbi:hypothetical protein N9891_01730 [bacterium]|nr:hypothetical protein [bacterium]
MSFISAQDCRLELGPDAEEAEDYLVVTFPTAEELEEGPMSFVVRRSFGLQNWSSLGHIHFEKDEDDVVRAYFAFIQFEFVDGSFQTSWRKESEIVVGEKTISYVSDDDRELYFFIGNFETSNQGMGNSFQSYFPRFDKSFVRLEAATLEFSEEDD